MIRVYITQGNRIAVGGGWVFNQNLKKALEKDVQFVDSLEQAQIFLISGVSLTTKEEVRQAMDNNIPIVFRVDNIPKPSRNRGMDVANRMRFFAEQAEAVIYQSKWSKRFAGDICGDGEVIYNGVDTSLFQPNGDKLSIDSTKQIFLFVNHSSNENKRWEEAHYLFSELWKDNKNTELWLVGRFENEQYNFDFIRGEKVRNFGTVENRNELAKIMRSANFLIYPAFADSCPNTVLEARASGLEIIGINNTGGTIELLNPDLDISLDRMGREYLSLFNLILGDK